MSEDKDPNNQLAEAIRLCALVVFALGLIAAGFYADAHSVDPALFWTGAVLVTLSGILDRVF